MALSRISKICRYMDGGSLTDLIHKQTLREEHVAYVILCLLRALQYLHSFGKVHR